MRCLQEPVACQGMHSWTFSGLIGAYVDLVVAYLLLCASAVAFFASKILGFLGLSLPCPCDGVFVYSNRNLCLQNLLVDGLVERVSSVQLSVTNKFPFGSTWERDRNFQLNVKLVRDGDNCVDGLVKMEGEASCSSTLGNTRNSYNMEGKDFILRKGSNMGLLSSSLDLKEEKFDFKGKGNITQRPRIGIRRRRKVTGNGNVSSASKNRASCSDGRSPYGINHKGFEGFECSSEPDFGVGFNQVQNGEDQVIKNIEKSSSPILELEYVDENNLASKNTSSSEGLKSNSQIELFLNDNEKHEIRILEQALEQEHAARSALYIELEKERSAAATAADEAMSMILRLQEEKASVEMEAHQFQRMIEEKAKYDAEEMNILKEIILRREREKHFLEKEIEAYRAIVNDGNASGELAFASTILDDDPDLMLQQLSESIDNQGRMRDKISVNEVASTSEKKYSVGNKGETDTLIPSSLDEHGFSDKIVIVSGEQEEDDVALELQRISLKSSETPEVIDVISDMENPIHDIHVIDNKFYLLKGTKGEKGEMRVENDNVNVLGTSGVKTEPIRWRSNSSDLIVGLPLLGSPVQGNSKVSDMRRNSMSGVDNERLKIDSEVGWLRERLRIVQEGRDKLNFSMERQERELFQVQLLEDIAYQLREIRQLTSPGKAARQASLPLLRPKVMSKKKRHQSVSLGVHKI